MADSDLDYCKIVGRIALAVGDGPDGGENPDLIFPDRGGTVTFEPLQKFVKVDGAVPPVTVGGANITAHIDEYTGFITYPEPIEDTEGLTYGDRRVWLLDLGSDKVNPVIARDKAAYRVTFKVSFNGTKVDFPSFTFHPLPGVDNDITLMAPVPVAGGNPIVVGPRGTSIQALSVQGGDLIATFDDGTEVNAGELPVGPGGTDEGVADYLDTPGAKARRATSRRFAQSPGGTIVAPELLTVGVNDGQAVDYFAGRVWGYGTGIFYSTNFGTSWTRWGSSPDGQLVSRMVPTPDGEMVLVTYGHIYKSQGWNLTSDVGVTWNLKVTSTGLAQFNRFCVSDDYRTVPGTENGATHLIATQYGPGSGQAWIDSRYGHVSVDGGTTWTLAWDSEVATPNTPVESHVHGCCYDPWEGVWYVAEGHDGASGGAGIYTSTATVPTTGSWTRHPGLIPPIQPAPTMLIATDDGIVCGSDSEDSGMWGIPRTGPLAQRKIGMTWRWRVGQSGVIGFGQHAFRDPETGIVYMGFKSSTVNAGPVIGAGTATQASKLYEPPLTGLDAEEISGVVVVNDRLIASMKYNGGTFNVRSMLPRPGSPTNPDLNNARSGVARSNSSVGIGPGVDLGLIYKAVVVGVRAIGAQSSVVLGSLARALASRVVAIGDNAAGQANSVVIGADASGNPATGSAPSAVAVGADSSVTGTRGTAVGHTATAGGANLNDATAVGQSAQATGTRASALGRAAVSSHTDSVALGASTATSAASQIQVGARHFEGVEVASLGNGAADTGRIAFMDDGSGNTVTVVRYSTGPVYRLSGTLHGSAVLDFPSIAAGTAQDLTIAVANAAVGQPVTFGQPSGVTTALAAGVIPTAWVSASGVVTVRLFNATAGAIDPASATWRVVVTRSI